VAVVPFVELRKAGQRLEAREPLSVLEVGEGVALPVLGGSPDEATDRMDRPTSGSRQETNRCRSCASCPTVIMIPSYGAGAGGDHLGPIVTLAVRLPEPVDVESRFLPEPKAVLGSRTHCFRFVPRYSSPAGSHPEMSITPSVEMARPSGTACRRPGRGVQRRPWEKRHWRALARWEGFEPPTFCPWPCESPHPWPMNRTGIPGGSI